MNWTIIIENGWIWFCLLWAMALLLSLWMERIGARFETNDGSLRPFNILDLEFPSNRLDIPNIINGIYRLNNEDRTRRVLAALRQSLYLDFLFMPAIYGAIFVLCMQISVKLGVQSPNGSGFFAVLAWLQILAWAADAYENSYLFRCIRPNLPEDKTWEHSFYVWVVRIKWGIALIAGVNGLMMAVYYWLSGNFRAESGIWILIFVLTLVLYSWMSAKMKKK